MKAKLRKTGEVVELRQYYCDGTAMDILYEVEDYFAQILCGIFKLIDKYIKSRDNK